MPAPTPGTENDCFIFGRNFIRSNRTGDVVRPPPRYNSDVKSNIALIKMSTYNRVAIPADIIFWQNIAKLRRPLFG